MSTSGPAVSEDKENTGGHQVSGGGDGGVGGVVEGGAAGKGSSADGLRIVAATVAGLQSSLGGAVLQMKNSLQQSLQMMDQMNTCMEEYVRSGLVLTACISNPIRGDIHNGPHLSLVARNTSRVPMLGITLSVTLDDNGGPFQRADASQAPFLAPADAAQPAAKRARTAAAPLAWRARSEDGDCAPEHTGGGSGAPGAGARADPHPPAPRVLVSGPLDLAPGEARSSELRVRLPAGEPARARGGTFTASVPSPGTGQPLPVRKAFTVGMVHAFAPAWAPDGCFCIVAGGVDLGAACRVTPEALRKVFRVPSRSGLPAGAVGMLVEPNVDGEEEIVAQVRLRKNEDAAEDGGEERVPVLVQVLRGRGGLGADAFGQALAKELASL